MAEAEDATHDAFEAAWRKWSTLRDPSRFDAWFQRILVNTCRNRLRHGGRRRIIDISAHVAAVEDAGIVAVDERSVLREAIAGLQPDDRVVLALRFSQDLTVDQIADVMGLRHGTVKSRLHHAIRRLRDRLDVVIVPGEPR